MPIEKMKINKYDETFKGIVEYNNNTFVLPYVIKGEDVEVEITKDLKKCTLKKILTPSPIRVKPICPIYDECGGCHLQHINYKEQLKLKTETIEELFFNSFSHLYEVLPTIGMSNPYNYRNKNQVVFKNVKGGKCRIACGFYKEGTHEVIEYDNCFIQDEISNKICESIKELMIKMHYNAYDEDHKSGLFRHVLIKRSSSTKEIMVVIVTGTDLFPGCQNFCKALVAKHKDITTIIQNINPKYTSAVLGTKEKVLYGKGYITDILMGLKFKISAHSFYQVNSIQCEKLYSQAIELACLNSNETLLDAYCGVGTIGLIASKSVGKVIGVEIVEDAVKDAIENAKYNNIKNARFFCDDASRFMINLSNKNEKIDVVVMDPPRKGSDAKFINSLLKLLPKKIIYISCNPYTQVEDLRLLLNKYFIKVIQPVDMFPNTNHVETVVCLSLKIQK